ncbi:MAG: pyruvate formate lyase family protein, partial [Candidatus Asgardarchaeum sp.]
MRVKLLRENVLNVIPQVCSERGKLITESYRETEGYPMVIRRAKALEKILANMTIYINDEELIVGNQASSPRAAPIFPEFSVNWLEKELGEFSNRDLDKFLVPEQTIDEIKEICAFWKGKTVQDRAVSLYSLLLGKKNLSYDLEFPEINSVVAHIISVGEGYGHIIPNYQKLMAKGIKGIVNEAQEILKDLKIIKNQDDVEKSVFLQAVITSCNAATRFIERFAEEAKSLKKKETSLQRKEELEKIADVCTWIKGNPPRNFWEALQLILFIHFIIQIESNGHAVSLGRLDQYLYPFYQRDIKEGRITEEEAVELLECSLIKCHELIKTRSWRCTPYKTGYPLFQTISLGGTKRDGSDATNELSYLFLKAVAEVKIPQPTLVVLIHNKTPNKFLIECWRTVRQHGGGMPGFFNNEVAVLSLVRAGASVEDAREWAVVGCSEIIIPGKGNSILNGGGCYINTLKILELILKNSISFNTFDDLKRVFRQELAFYMKYVPLLVSVTVKAHKELAPTPFLSSLIDYRLEIGKD